MGGARFWRRRWHSRLGWGLLRVYCLVAFGLPGVESVAGSVAGVDAADGMFVAGTLLGPEETNHTIPQDFGVGVPGPFWGLGVSFPGWGWGVWFFGSITLWLGIPSPLWGLVFGCGWWLVVG